MIKFYLNKNQYKDTDNKPDFKNAKMVIEESIPPGTYDGAAWMGEGKYGPYIKVEVKEAWKGKFNTEDKTESQEPEEAPKQVREDKSDIPF
tara:strand:+ start:1904 stop:2176 length:273 start_codon:yes stop_codon:yes gene_type:complete